MTPTSPRPERTVIGGSLQISRMISGLWQLAGGHDINFSLNDCAENMQPLIEAGLTTFDMADRECLISTLIYVQKADV